MISFTKRNISGRQIKKTSCIPICICMLYISCTSVHVSPDLQLTEQIKAENRIMKQNLTSALRENSILKDENIQYRGDNNSQKARIKQLESDIESMKKKYELDISMLNEKQSSLEKKNRILEQESSLKIHDLTAVNKALELKMTAEITKLNESLRSQEEKFSRERAAIEITFSSKEQEYQKQAARNTEEKLSLRMDIESLKSRLAESEANLESLRKELAEKEKQNRILNSRIGDLTKTNEQK